jgi:dipeptidyl-peptidase-4
MRVRDALAGAAVFLSLRLALAAAPPGAAKKPLTLERISSEASAAEPPLVARGAFQTAWRDARHLTYLETETNEAGAKPSLFEYDVATGKKTRLLKPLPVPAEKTAQSGEKEPTPKTLPFAGALWSADGRLLLLSGESDLYVYDFGTKALRRLTHDEAEEESATFSPDGTHVAYVKKNDLYAVDVASGKEKRLTTTGAPHVLNGKLDWVYEEELANRRSGRSYEWAPDSRALVYLRLDETRVPEYPIVDFLPTHGRLMPQRYPKVGDPNSVASVHVVDLRGKETASLPGPEDGYVAPELAFTADSRSACALLMNRAQTEISVVLLPRDGGANAKPRVLLVEKDAAWINSIEPPRFLKDGSGFLFLSERTGFLHLYRHDMTGALRNAVTSGSWMLDRSFEVDERSGWVYFTATEGDPRGRQVYRAKLDGSSSEHLSKEHGTHTIDLSPDGALYVDRSSDVATPPRLALFHADGERVALVDEPATRLAEYAIGTTELGSFAGSDGTLFYTSLVKPSHFDPSKKYPVVVAVYGGPHAQVVQDRWGATSMLELLMAEKGFLVFSMDNRGSWGRGHAFETPILKNMGAQELKDQLEGVEHLKKLPFVDPSRIGITGWSYGGYMTLFAATHAGDVFKCAVAGAPVVDWKLYDTIYTERYMKLPKENAEGYKTSSPLQSASQLGTKLLILHGTSDDNVHMQNTVAFLDALMRARKDFVFVPLPGQKHGPRDPAARLYTNQRILEFFEKNL